MDILIYTMGMAGTVAFAVTAVLALAPLRVDLFGATVLGIVTAIGGGTIRDVILDEPVFWAHDLNYIWAALAASVAAFIAQPFFTRKDIGSLMLYLDGLGAALFGIEATAKRVNLIREVSQMQKHRQSINAFKMDDRQDPGDVVGLNHMNAAHINKLIFEAVL